MLILIQYRSVKIRLSIVLEGNTPTKSSRLHYIKFYRDYSVLFKIYTIFAAIRKSQNIDLLERLMKI